MFFSGFEISDVLSINDKDYSITFGLYFSVEWVEPRYFVKFTLGSPHNVSKSYFQWQNGFQKSF